LLAEVKPLIEGNYADNCGSPKVAFSLRLRGRALVEEGAFEGVPYSVTIEVRRILKEAWGYQFFGWVTAVSPTAAYAVDSEVAFGFERNDAGTYDRGWFELRCS